MIENDLDQKIYIYITQIFSMKIGGESRTRSQESNFPDFRGDDDGDGGRADDILLLPPPQKESCVAS